MNFFKELITGFKEGQKKFAEIIAIIINSLLLTIVYFFGVGLTSIFGKLLGKSFLDMGFDKTKNTYWEELNFGRQSVEECLRQF